MFATVPGQKHKVPPLRSLTLASVGMTVFVGLQVRHRALIRIVLPILSQRTREGCGNREDTVSY
jgi:hypothetical protein